MSWQISTQALRTDADVVSARLAARRLAELLGLERREQTRIATAVSEIVRNAVEHGGGGEIGFTVETDSGDAVFAVRVHDNGPGMPDNAPDASRLTPALGLQSARRLVDEFDLQSTPGGGVRVRLGQRIARQAAARLDAAAIQAAARQFERRIDPLLMVQQQNRELAESLSDLRERQDEALRLNAELEETNRGVVALYSELDERADQLRQVSDLKTRFLSHMSHEFRTPLNSILALSRLLSDRVDGPLNSEQERQVDYIRRSAQDLLEMVNDLLDLAKVEAGHLEVKTGPFRVSEMFRALRGSLKPLQLKPAVDLVFEAADDLPELVTDQPKVAQVLRNFIANALKFTERGEVRVSAAHDAARGFVSFSVRDTGVGIAPEFHARIFEEFAQIDGRLQNAGSGTGLGLPLSRRLATLLGGEVTMNSTPGVGSTFCLALPVRLGQAAAAPAVRPPGEHQPLALVVDDEESFRYVVRHIAQDSGLSVQEAGDGEAALALARQCRPDVIVLDLAMPRLDGFATLARLRADSALCDTPVIVCTSQMLTLDQKRSLASAYAIVPKHDISREGLAGLLRAAIHHTAPSS